MEIHGPARADARIAGAGADAVADLATGAGCCAGIWLFAPYVVFRTTGKLAGGWLASRLAPEVAPSDLGAYLIPPGVIGIAFALNVLQVSPDHAAPIVFAVSAGAIVSELLAVVVTPAPVGV